MMTKSSHRIASIPGDGIGKEVIPQDGIFFGAVGSPGEGSDHISLWGSLVHVHADPAKGPGREYPDEARPE